jgi:hypothetical protein
MNFGQALEVMKNGGSVTIEGWGFRLVTQYPDEQSMMTEPYLVCIDQDGFKMPYNLQNSDLFCDEWIEVGND